jgi:threonine/homoserine/homoserine lactone efflux protein
VPDASHLALFVAAALALLAIPGPAVLFIVAQSVSHGRRAGLVSVLGIHAGSLVHVTAAVVGLSSLLVFFFAFLPQLVEPAAGSVPLQTAVYGVVLVLLGLVTDSLWAVAAGRAGGRLRASHGFARAERFVSGAVLVGLGVVTAVAGSRKA